MRFFHHLYEVVLFIYQRFNDTKGLEAAAAIAYYSLFSLCPLLVIVVAFNSSFLQTDSVREQVVELTEQYLPGSRSLVEGNIQHLISGSATVGFVGMIVMLWAASLVFAGIVSNINQAWVQAVARNFLIDRLMGLAIIGCMLLLVIASPFVTAVVNLSPHTLYKLGGPVLLRMGYTAKLCLSIVPFLSLFIALTLMYRWVPNTRVCWREAVVGGLFATTMLEITKFGFISYLSSGLGSYQLVYGSLGAVVVFMLWIYLSTTVVLLGAHVSAAVAHRFRHLYGEAVSTSI